MNLINCAQVNHSKIKSMKQFLLSISAIICIATSASATTHVITVRDFSFTPATLNVNLGDTVRWTWVQGSHTTTSTTIPAGAASWDRLMTASSTGFTYVPTVSGTYNYQCTPHASMGHVGSFVVASATSVPSATQTALFSMYPNPAKETLLITLADARQQATVTISDALGRVVRTTEIGGTSGLRVSIADLADGLYMIRAISGGRAYAQALQVAR